MHPKPPRTKAEKPTAPEWTWGECPAGQPAVRWEHSARPLWVQVLPEHAALFLMEKSRYLLRSLDNGRSLWEGRLEDLPDELAHDVSGIVLAAQRDLRELEPKRGADRWRIRTGGVVTALVLSPDTVYAATRGPLVAISRQDGKQRWKVPSAWEPELQVHPEANLVVVDNPETETLLGLDVTTGETLWEHTADGQPVAAGPLVGGLIPISRHAAGVAAVDARTGETRWTLESEGAWEHPGVPLGDQLFFTDGAVWAVNAATGEVAWQRKLEEEEDQFFSIRVVPGAKPMLLAESWRGRLLALSPADGSLLWERRPGQAHGFAADDETLYLRLNISHEESGWAVAALDRGTGDLRWELRAPKLIPDLTLVGNLLVVELKNAALVLNVREMASAG